MKTMLISTSSLWNCGDDFIRDGVLALLGLRPDVRQLWWNRGFGIGNRYANDLAVNLPLSDYFLVAGTPRWIFNNEAPLEYCLRKGIPVAFIGVGTAEFVGPRGYNLVRRLARSGLCEVVLARDDLALAKLRELGFANAELMLDPCFFKPALPAGAQDLSIVGWRVQYSLDGDPKLPLRYPWTVAREVLRRKPWRRSVNGGARQRFDHAMRTVFESMTGPRLVVVHDNREIAPAEALFGADNVFHATDHKVMFETFARARTYVGSRIHGAIPTLIHGGSVSLMYATTKSSVLDHARRTLAAYDPALADLIRVQPIDAPPAIPAPVPAASQAALRHALDCEFRRVRARLEAAPVLRGFIDTGTSA